jgi:hypothetical protein
VNGKVKNIFLATENIQVFFLTKEDEKDKIYIVQDFEVTLFIDKFDATLQFTPFNVTSTEVSFHIFQKTNGKAQFFTKDRKKTYDFSSLGVPTFSLYNIGHQVPQAKMLS